MNWLALLAGLLSGIAGAMGLGGGAVLIIYLALFTDVSQLTAQGINLMFFIPTAVVAVTVYAVKKRIKWKLTLKIAAWGMLGAVYGIYFTGIFGGEITGKIFGALLIAAGICEIFEKKEKSVAERHYK